VARAHAPRRASMCTAIASSAARVSSAAASICDCAACAFSAAASTAASTAALLRIFLPFGGSLAPVGWEGGHTRLHRPRRLAERRTGY
jgi:hypothetical protein